MKLFDTPPGTAHASIPWWLIIVCGVILMVTAFVVMLAVLRAKAEKRATNQRRAARTPSNQRSDSNRRSTDRQQAQYQAVSREDNGNSASVDPSWQRPTPVTV